MMDLTLEEIKDNQSQAIKNFSNFGELVWAIGKTKTGKKFLEELDKRFLDIPTWLPNSNQFNIYYHEGQRSVIIAIKQALRAFKLKQKSDDERNLKNA